MAATAQRVARYATWSAVGLSAAGLGQVAHLRLGYVSPEEPEGLRHGQAGQGLRGPPLRLLFVGDSICMGVGATRAAPLQAACAERLAALRQRPVLWRTVAATGADVRELSALLAARLESEGAQGVGSAFDIAVVFCGVNDGKKLFQGRFPSVFRDDLAALCAALRRQAPEGRISVPLIPGYVGAPLLQLWPMRHLVGFFVRQFEAQKEFLAQSELIHCPTPPPDSLPGPADTSLWAADGIHPSGEGYRLVGEWLGAALARPEE